MMVVPIESVPGDSFSPESNFLIDLDRAVVVSYDGESEPMESSLLRYLDRSFHHRGSKSDVLKVLMYVDEEFRDALASFERDPEHLQVSDNSLIQPGE